MNDSGPDQSSSQTNTPQVFTPSLSYHSYLPWVIASLILLVVLLIGLNYFNILSLSKLLPNQLGWLPHKPILLSFAPPQAGKELKCIPERHLRISNDLLQNYLVEQWRGNVDGALTAYDGKSITISKEGHSLTIPLTSSTTFAQQLIDKNKVQYQDAKLSNKYIGWNVRGSFFVTGKDKDWKDTFVGSDFTFYKTSP